MNILSEVNELLRVLNIPIETGVFKGEAVDNYIVLVPLSDTYPFNADNKPEVDVQELRITIYSKSNYLKLKSRIQSIMLSNDFYITERKFNGYDTGTGYYQYTIDVANNYQIEEDKN